MIRGNSRVAAGALLVVLGGLAGFGITFAARSARAQPQAMDQAAAVVLDWLQVPGEQREAIGTHDPAFAGDLKRLREALATSRSELAAALENTEATAEQIRGRSEAMIAASAALERRVTEHLVSIRHHLTTEQQKRLFGLCAEGVRQGRGWQWRRGQSGEGGMGMGRGMGRGYRGGRGAAEQPGPTTGPAGPGSG